MRLVALALLLSGCHAELVAIPGTARDAYWRADCGPWWYCAGSGPIHQVCTETVLWPFGWNRRDCQWRRVDPEGKRLGAVVPYREETKR